MLADSILANSMLAISLLASSMLTRLRRRAPGATGRLLLLVAGILALGGLLPQDGEAARPDKSPPAAPGARQPLTLGGSPPPTPAPQPWSSETAALHAVAEHTMQMDLGRWDWDTAVALHGLMRAAEATGEARYAAHVRGVVDEATTAGVPEVSHPNHVAPGLAVLDLHAWYGDERYLALARRIGDRSRNLPRVPASAWVDRVGTPRAPGFGHGSDEELWVDTVFMTVPFLARLAIVTGEPEWMQEAVDQFLTHARVLTTPWGVYRHAWRYQDGRADALGGHWLRGNGWAAAAGVDLLRSMPVGHPDREAVALVVADQLAAVAAWQTASGRWTTVIDAPTFYEETSGGAAMAYAIARGLSQGHVGSGYDITLERARSGIVARVGRDGGVLEVSGATGPEPNPEGYDAVRHDEVVPWGQGLTMMALAEPRDGFAIRPDRPGVFARPGDTVTATVRVSARWGAPGPVAFTVAAATRGISTTLVEGGDEAHVTMRVRDDAAPGPRVVPVSASGVVTRTAAISVRVLESLHTVYLPSATQVLLAAARSLPTLPDRLSHLDVLGERTTGSWEMRSAPGLASAASGQRALIVQADGDIPRVARAGQVVRGDGPRLDAGGIVLAVAGDPLRCPGRGLSCRDVARFTGRAAAGALSYPIGRSGENRGDPDPHPLDDRIAYVARAPSGGQQATMELRIADAGRGITTALAADAPIYPAWSPDGRHLAYIETGAEDGRGAADPSVLVIDTEERSVYWVDAGRWRGYKRAPRWSPNGRWLLAQGNGDVHLLDPYGGPPLRSIGRGSVWSGAWSPRGLVAAVFEPTRARLGARSGPRLRPVEIAVPLPDPPRPFPPPGLDAQIWAAADAFVTVHPPDEVLAGYEHGPARGGAAEAVTAACADWPDLDGRFGEGVRGRACETQVAGYLALYHAVAAGRPAASDADSGWAAAFLDVGLDGLADFVYGPETAGSAGYRDTLPAVWQNPLRAMALVLAADLLRRQGELPQATEERVVELLSGVVRAWQSHWWAVGIQPSTGVSLTTGTADDYPGVSLAGEPVVSKAGHYFAWDADAGRSPAEEVAWLGAGIMVATRVLGARLPEAPEVAAEARHFTSLAVAYDRRDAVRGGSVRTLNRAATGGAYGQRRYWIENHYADAPAVPYVGSVWHSLGASMLAHGGPWPEMVEVPADWRALWGSAEETMRAADGRLLVDQSALGRGGFALDGFPEWVTACGNADNPRPYVRFEGQDGPAFLSEIGHPATSDLLAAAVGLMRVADHVDDDIRYDVWARRARALLIEARERPPDPSWARCKVATYVSANRAYHWARMLAAYMQPYLAAAGHRLEAW